MLPFLSISLSFTLDNFHCKSFLQMISSWSPHLLSRFKSVLIKVSTLIFWKYSSKTLRDFLLSRIKTMLFCLTLKVIYSSASITFIPSLPNINLRPQDYSAALPCLPHSYQPPPIHFSHQSLRSSSSPKASRALPIPHIQPLLPWM